MNLQNGYRISPSRSGTANSRRNRPPELAASFTRNRPPAVPERLRPFIAEPSIGAPPGNVVARDGLDIARTRAWIRSGRKIRIRYRNQRAQDSQRTIWPVIIGYAETVRLLAAWCELRQDFRHFRTDRIVAADFLDEHHGSRPGELRTRWKRHMENERGVRLS